MILSLDISTTAIGVSIVKPGRVIHLTDAIVLKKEKNLLKKLDIVQDYLIQLKSRNFKFSEIRVEEFLMGFQRGKSSAQTITKLAGFNTAVQYLLYKTFKKEPVLVNAQSKRKDLGITIDKSKDTKQQLMEWVESNCAVRLPRKILKSGPRKGKEVMADHANDIADAIIVGI